MFHQVCNLCVNKIVSFQRLEGMRLNKLWKLNWLGFFYLFIFYFLCTNWRTVSSPDDVKICAVICCDCSIFLWGFHFRWTVTLKCYAIIERHSDFLGRPNRPSKNSNVHLKYDVIWWVNDSFVGGGPWLFASLECQR